MTLQTAKYTVLLKMNLVFPFRNSKPKNRPSFQQVLLHVEIAAGDVLKTPQEIYLNKQVRQKTKNKEKENIHVTKP